jgi:hypothetical protein
VTGRRVQTAGLMLLGHSRLLLHPKPAVSRGKMSRVNLTSEKERINYSIHRAMYLDKREPTENLCRYGMVIES